MGNEKKWLHSLKKESGLAGAATCSAGGESSIRKTPDLLFITFLYFFMLFSKKHEKVQKSPVLYFF